MKRIVAFLVALLIIFSICSVAASAAASPTPVVYHSVTVGIKGHGYAETNKTAVADGETVTLTALSGDQPFEYWEITGTFEPVDGGGDELSSQLTIRPTSDIIAIAVFMGGSDSEAVISTPTDKSPTSPQTGQSALPVYITLALMTICTGGIMISTSKLRKSKR